VEIRNSNAHGKLDEDRLAAFERRLGSAVPDEYRRFLVIHNGGNPEPRAFVIPPDGAEGQVENLYGLHDGPDYLQLEGMWEIYRPRLPPGLLPVGDDPNGNALCLGLAGGYRGKVLFWDHERALSGSDPCADMPVIAADFDALLAGLHPSIDG